MVFVDVLKIAVHVSSKNFFLIKFFFTGLLTYLCPLIQVYYIASKIEGGESPWCYVCAICTPLKECYDLAALRGEVRASRGIKGTLIGDYFAAFYCAPCSLIQERRVCTYIMYYSCIKLLYRKWIHRLMNIWYVNNKVAYHTVSGQKCNYETKFPHSLLQYFYSFY